MSTRTLGMLAVLAASSLFIPPILTGGNREPVWAWWIPIGSLIAFTATALGLAWQFKDHIGPLGIVGAILVPGAILVTLGAATIVGANAAFLAVLPAGSAMLMWDLGRIGVLSRPASIAHLAAAVTLVIGLAVALLAQGSFALGLVGGVSYLLSWIAIGVSLIRGAARRQATRA
jgi:hypothetical protein